MDNSGIALAIEENLGVKVISLIPCGKGATASVYCAETANPPRKLAVKVGADFALLSEEKAMLDFLGARVPYKVPETYFLCPCGDKFILGMEYIEGKTIKTLLFVRNKKALAGSIMDAFEGMQRVTNNSFGKYTDPHYASWAEYYHDFFAGILSFSREMHHSGRLSSSVWDSLGLIEKHFDEIFSDVTGPAVLCHGDFWLPNMLIDPKQGKLVGILDPFDVLWAEREYEIFCFTVTRESKKLGLYELYKNRNPVSEYCDLKVELYALVNELHWYKRLGSIGHGYLELRAKNFCKQMKKHFGED